MVYDVYNIGVLTVNIHPCHNNTYQINTKMITYFDLFTFYG